MAADKIFLIGMMGSGKSFWKKKISKWIQAAGYDLDDLIEMNEEKTISEIFDQDGEANFRKSEAKILRWFKEKKKFVLATGGGTPCYSDNMEWMKKQGMVIWLDESLEVLVKRLEDEKSHRPLIARLEAAAMTIFLQEKLKERFSFYHQADYRLSSEMITEANIKKIIQNHGS